MSKSSNEKLIETSIRSKKMERRRGERGRDNKAFLFNSRFQPFIWCSLPRLIPRSTIKRIVPTKNRKITRIKEKNNKDDGSLSPPYRSKSFKQFPFPHFHRASTIAPQRYPVNTYRSYRIRGGFRGNYAVNNHDLEVGGFRLNGAMGA